MERIGQIDFPDFSGIRCMMMPFIQGDPESIPKALRGGYERAIELMAHESGQIGFLTIDESLATAGSPHRGARANFGRALHTEAGLSPSKLYAWGRSHRVTLDGDAQVLLANSISGSCAIWDAEHANTSEDGDIGYAADQYPLREAHVMTAGEVQRIGILTPHESLPVMKTVKRQFLRVVSSGVHGREPHFTANPLVRHNPKYNGKRGTSASACC